jgi:hypothetical protein
MAVAAQFFNRLREREMFAHGGFDDFDQPGKRKFKRDGGELNLAFRGNGVRRRDRGAGNGNARPPAQRRIIAQLGGVGISGALNVREPVARFRMNVNFANRMAFDLAGVNAQDEMAVGGARVELQLLLARQIPMRVKPVRVARGQKKFLCAVGLGQFGFRRFKMLRRRHGAERVFPAGAAGGRRRGLVAFEQERRNFNFFAADVSAAGGCGFWFGGAARAHTRVGGVFFLAGAGVGFVFITAIPCFGT